MSGFFAIKKEFFTKTKFRIKGYKILLNILRDNRGIKIKEIPYLFKDRRIGETKLGPSEFIEYLLDLFRLMGGQKDG
jgi:dolichol-phosphate mannosyltransferase